jgi:hypothetical protein
LKVKGRLKHYIRGDASGSLKITSNTPKIYKCQNYTEMITSLNTPYEHSPSLSEPPFAQLCSSISHPTSYICTTTLISIVQRRRRKIWAEKLGTKKTSLKFAKKNWEWRKLIKLAESVLKAKKKWEREIKERKNEMNCYGKNQDVFSTKTNQKTLDNPKGVWSWSIL